MYIHNHRQQNFWDNDPLLFGGIPLKATNRWVQLAQLTPWDVIETLYVESLKDGSVGRPAKSSREAFGTLIIKEMLNLSDRDTVLAIQESPYLQYYLGYGCYNYDVSLDASSLTYFRRRFPAEDLAKINAKILERYHGIDRDDDSDAGGSDLGSHQEGGEESQSVEVKDNQGTLLLDATCAPQDIQYPTDVRLLHEAREKLEALIDVLHEGSKLSKPRTYRKKANREYKRFCRIRRPKSKTVRQAKRKQLGYLRRDLKHIEELQTHSEVQLTQAQEELLEVIQTLFSQQEEMYQSKSQRCDDRIVSLHQPWVRPIVRGKASRPVEFGSKIAISMLDGLAEIERLSWDAFNESSTLISTAEAYYERHGFYPEKIITDKIYRTRENHRYCKERNIKLSGPPLGRPPKDKRVYEELKAEERRDSSERNAVEGKFGEGKRRYGLGLIKTRTKESSETQIHLIVLVMNLQKILRDLFYPIFDWLFFALSGDSEVNIFSRQEGLCTGSANS